MTNPAVLDDGVDRPKRPFTRWLITLMTLGIATAGMLAVRASLDKAHVALVYLLIVLVASAVDGRRLGFVVAGTAFVCFDFFFLQPYLTLTIQNPLDWLVLVAFLVTSLVAAQLLYRARATADAATQRALEVDRLAALGAETLNAADASEALRAIAQVIRESVGAEECEIVLPTAERVSPGSLDAWILDRGATAAELTDGTVRIGGDLPARAHALAIPLRVRDRIVGVLRIAAKDELRLTHEQHRLLVALAYYAALGAERVRLVAAAERAEAERRMESMRSALLTAVSHDLRTPLTTIKGVASELRGGPDDERASIIEGEADRMDHLVTDLLDLSRIHAKAVQPNVSVNTADDLIGAALRAAAGPLAGRTVNVTLPPDSVAAGMFDFTQSLRIVVNLLDNAAKYSPRSGAIDVRVSRRRNALVFEILDRGAGIPPGERGNIFDAFYRPAGVSPDVRGHGLGLSIARGLAEAQNGTLDYAVRDGGGSIFTLELPGVDVEELPSAADLVGVGTSDAR